MKKQKIVTALAALGLAMGIMTGTSQAITIDTVTVGDAGNAADTTGYGAVAYAYLMGKYEVTIGQYTSFLNAVAVTDTYSLYHPDMTMAEIAGISRDGSQGGYSYAVMGTANRPVVNVSWFDAARFANWMANGQTTGAQGATTTENGAYTLNGAMTGVGFTKNAINPNTGQATTWWIPSQNEWYKAAYYKGGSTNAGYWVYPTQSNTAPGNTIGSNSNQANYYNGAYSTGSAPYLTEGGAFSNSASFYGTYDQAGNAFEWNDGVFGGTDRGFRGGSWDYAAWDMESANPQYYDAASENIYLGFRLAGVAVPEPSSGLLLLVGAGAVWLVKRRKVTL